MSSGIVMNGPTPIMFVMFSAVADRSPKRRESCRCSEIIVGAGRLIGFERHRKQILRDAQDDTARSSFAMLRMTAHCHPEEQATKDLLLVMRRVNHPRHQQLAQGLRAPM
jgi:hypothetical protein